LVELSRVEIGVGLVFWCLAERHAGPSATPTNTVPRVNIIDNHSSRTRQQQYTHLIFAELLHMIFRFIAFTTTDYLAFSNHLASTSLQDFNRINNTANNSSIPSTMPTLSAPSPPRIRSVQLQYAYANIELILLPSAAVNGALVAVEVRPKRKIYRIHEAVLVYRSKYFRNAL
jgi:hypothetical protein